MEKTMTRQSSRNKIAFIFSLIFLLTLAQAHVLAQTSTTEQPVPNYTRPTSITRPVAQPQPAQPVPAQPTMLLATPDVAPPQPVIIPQALLMETLDEKIVAEQGPKQESR